MHQFIEPVFASIFSVAPMDVCQLCGRAAERAARIPPRDNRGAGVRASPSGSKEAEAPLEK
ncbi:MAG: hypothetical protein GY914_06760 [Prochlorococcus sp.]|nr:hypothetical protein [Prochlorococcus sp.]